MTEIVLDRSARSVSFRGHAGFAPRGRDPVCAAISMLMYTLCEIPGAKFEPGEASALVRVDTERESELEAICRGLRLLARCYPGCVRFIERGGEGKERT